MKEVYSDDIIETYGQTIEDMMSEAVFNYAKPILKIKGEINEKSIGKKLQWRGIKLITINLSTMSKIMFCAQRNIIISRFVFSHSLYVYVSEIKHPFFKKDYRGKNFEKIKSYLNEEMK